MGPRATSPTRSCAPTWLSGGLYEQELQLLVCPCHQSMFNVTNGAIPVRAAPRRCPVAAVRGRERVSSLTARLLRTGGPDSGSEVHRRMSSDVVDTKRAQRQAAGPYGKVGNAINELDERLGVAKGGRTFMTRSSPITGPSCSVRSRSTRSLCS